MDDPRPQDQNGTGTQGAAISTGPRAFEGSSYCLRPGPVPEINDRDVEAANAVRERIRDTLNRELDERLVQLPFGGSVAKNTYVDGLSDTDALAIFRHVETKDVSPEEIKNRITPALESAFPEAKVSVGNVAITIEHQDGSEFQLVPAVREGSSIRIPSWDGQAWSKIDTRKFTKALSRYNQRLSGKLIPTIKLAKKVLAQLPEKSRISGYHLESLAVDVFRDYTGPHTTARMLPEFFERATKAVLSPIKDTSGQSLHVDEYLGGQNSEKRRAISHLFNRLAKRMNDASANKSDMRWEEILGM